MTSTTTHPTPIQAPPCMSGLLTRTATGRTLRLNVGDRVAWVTLARGERLDVAIRRAVALAGKGA